jgi:hypothetical protein
MTITVTSLRVVLAACALAACGCSSAPATSGAQSDPSGYESVTADNWVIVAPGGAGPSNTNRHASLDVLSGSARAVTRVPGLPGRGMVAYPWAVSGQYLAALTGIPDSAQDKAADGIAYAFRPGGAYVRLGPAIAVYAASQADSGFGAPASGVPPSRPCRITAR